MTQSAPHKTPVIIIGTGFGGIAMAVALQKAGYDDFIMLEKAATLGGTWRDNTYPGAECDIPSALYSYSFAPNPTWDFKWAKQPQILAYIHKVAKDYDLMRHMRFNQAVTDARYQNGRWAVTATDGTQYDGQFLISAVGQLHHPAFPNIKGVNDFAGHSFHSAQWNHAIDLTGKNIGVIGNAASAVQFIPEIAKSAGHVTVYQRSANWVIDKGDRPYTRIEKAVAKRLPWLAKFYRFGLWGLGEYVIWPVIKGAKWRAAILRAKNRWDMGRHIKDPAMRAVLTPLYPMGAKRILFSDKYYETLAQDTVNLVTDSVKAVTAAGIKTADGTTRDHEVIIYGTGFHTNPFLKDISVCGEGGALLHDVWADGARAYMGTMVDGFPNLFTLYGPNTNTGHTSIIFKLEAQAGYVVQLIKAARAGHIAVQPAAAEAFDREMQHRLAKLAWDKVDRSWYKDGTRLTNNWPGPSREFKRRAEKPKWEDFIIQPKRS